MPLMDAGFEYLAYGPASGAPNKLIILLHGYGRNAHYMEKMAQAARLAVPQALVLCPHGPEKLDTKEIDDKGTDHFLHVPQEVAQPGRDKPDDSLSRQWFRIDGQLDQLMPRIRKTAQQLNDFIDTQRDMLGITDRDILVMGFSQGAGLALYTAFSRRSEIAGMICHSAIAVHKPEGDPDMVSKPESFYIYGDRDGEFKQDRYHATFQWLQSYTGGRASEKMVTGLGHFTNAESRQYCADFMRKVLG